MNFAPRPTNDFPEFIETYYERCRRVCPGLRAMAGKWEFEDLIPGLSDFDSRLIFADETTPANWADASLAVGAVHREVLSERPDWARILEHPPGVNLTLSEFRTMRIPERALWSIYRGPDPAAETTAWSEHDERFHLKKFANYFGRYIRGIDPPVNLGRFESKYPLHSRYWHYFTPAVQAAVALVLRRPVRGKFESLRLARTLFPHTGILDLVHDAVECHYEKPEDYVEPRLTGIEDQLEEYLKAALAVVKDRITLLPLRGDETPDELRQKCGRMKVDPAARFFDNVRFARLMLGRLLFYLEPAPYFETDFLLRNELGRIGKWFYNDILSDYGEAKSAIREAPERVLASATATVISTEEARAFKQFSQAVARSGDSRERVREIVTVFQHVQIGIERLALDLQCVKR